MSLYILVPPRYIEHQVLRASYKIFFLNSSFLGTHTRFWNRKVPFSCATNPGDFPFSRFCFILWSSGSLS